MLPLSSTPAHLDPYGSSCCCPWGHPYLPSPQHPMWVLSHPGSLCSFQSHLHYPGCCSLVPVLLGCCVMLLIHCLPEVSPCSSPWCCRHAAALAALAGELATVRCSDMK